MYTVVVYTQLNGVVDVDIVQVYKSGDQFEPQNYRSITILNTFSKIVSCLFINRIDNLISENNIINNERIGFHFSEKEI